MISVINVYTTWNNFLLALLSMELSMIAVITLYLIFSFIIDDITNQILAILILTIAAAETVIGLLLLINFVNLKHSVSIEEVY